MILTLGDNGSIYQGNNQTIVQKAYRFNALDTTAAGDTFTGYFLAGIARGMSMDTCLSEGAKASAIAVTRRGAASSIPTRDEVLSTMLN